MRLNVELSPMPSGNILGLLIVAVEGSVRLYAMCQDKGKCTTGPASAMVGEGTTIGELPKEWTTFQRLVDPGQRNFGVQLMFVLGNLDQQINQCRVYIDAVR
jgi:hypothetical protein